jgi:hypothetical protein
MILKRKKNELQSPNVSPHLRRRSMDAIHSIQSHFLCDIVRSSLRVNQQSSTPRATTTTDMSPSLNHSPMGGSPTYSFLSSSAGGDAPFTPSTPPPAGSGSGTSGTVSGRDRSSISAGGGPMYHHRSTTPSILSPTSASAVASSLSSLPPPPPIDMTVLNTTGNQCISPHAMFYLKVTHR